MRDETSFRMCQDSSMYFETFEKLNKCGGVLERIKVDNTKPTKKEQDAKLIQWLKLFAIESDRGVGDIVERMLSKVGGRAIKMSLKKLGVNCGCTNRQEALNKKYPL